MALETMTKIATYTVGTGGITSYTFANIPQTYTDLRLVVSARTDRSGQPVDNIKLGINGQAANTGITGIDIYSNGSGTVSNTYAQVAGGVLPGSTATASSFGSSETYFYNYSNNLYKVISNESVSETNGTPGYVLMNDAIWSYYNPITSITVYPDTGPNFLQHSTFTLYGIRNAAKTVGNIKASGGNIVKFDGTYWYHVFTSTGTLLPFASTTAEALVVGGGGGGIAIGGGAGAGGLVYGTVRLSAVPYTVTVGGGGTGTDYAVANSGGSDSSFAALRAFGGGAGKGPQGVNGNGGSGGGGGFGDNSIGTSTSGVVVGSVGTAYGNNGGLGSDSPVRVTGGGGGAGAVGAGYSGNVSGNGGVGSSMFSQWGVATGTGQNSSGIYYYAGGGGGGGDQQAGAGTPGTGGLGGGGNGSINSSTAQAGSTNTGGGGGGGGRISGTTYSGGSGGSGIVIIRYKG